MGLRVSETARSADRPPQLGRRQARGLDRAGQFVPAGRWGNPSEIAQAVVFLASEEASFTGEEAELSSLRVLFTSPNAAFGEQYGWIDVYADDADGRRSGDLLRLL